MPRFSVTANTEKYVQTEMRLFCYYPARLYWGGFTARHVLHCVSSSLNHHLISEMTWQEFKAAVEQQGVQDDDTIFSIETGSYPNVGILKVDIVHLPSGERDICIDGRREQCPAWSRPLAGACKPMMGDMYSHTHASARLWWSSGKESSVGDCSRA